MLYRLVYCRSIASKFDSFSQGFKILCDGPAIRLFNACEVERLVCGNPNLDFDALERNAKYEGGFSTSTPAVMWLWGIVKSELTFDEKKMFLKFFTGSDRWVPVECLLSRQTPTVTKH